VTKLLKFTIAGVFYNFSVRAVNSNLSGDAVWAENRTKQAAGHGRETKQNSIVI